MRKQIARLLSICLLLLSGNVWGIAQQTQSATQENSSAAAQEKEAAARAEAGHRRAAAQAKRMVEQQKRTEKRMAAVQERAVKQAIKQAAHPDGIFKLLGSKGPGLGKVVKGAPYSATATTEHTQTLSDGNQINQKNEATYYRDSEGRIRIDQKLKTIGKWTAAGDPPQVITIFDPVAGNYYSLNPQTRTALMDVRGPQKIPTSTIGPQGPIGPKHLNVPKPAPSTKPDTDPHIVPGKGSERERKKELLGTRVIEGISAEGIRSTVTIPAGEIGNIAPIEIIDEHWYSPELQVPVMTTHHDPRSGDTIYKLTNINRSEPARSLFEVPADYRIIDRRAPKLPAGPKQPTPAEPPKKTEIMI